jgi:hypothetical protein
MSKKLKFVACGAIVLLFLCAPLTRAQSTDLLIIPGGIVLLQAGPFQVIILGEDSDKRKIRCAVLLGEDSDKRKVRSVVILGEDSDKRKVRNVVILGEDSDKRKIH